MIQNGTQPYNVEEASMLPMPPIPPKAEGRLSAEEVEPFPRVKSQREQDNEQSEQLEQENELFERQHYQRQGYHLREVKIPSDSTLSIPEQYNKVLKYLGRVTYSGYTSFMKRYVAYNKGTDNYDRNDCTGLVLSLLANKREFGIITARESIPSIRTMEQVLRCKFIPMQCQSDSLFKESLKDFITVDGIYIGGIITEPYNGPVSHMMLLVVSRHNEKIVISVFDPQILQIEYLGLFGINHDSRFVILDKMFRTSKKVSCSLFQPDNNDIVDKLDKVTKKMQTLTRTVTHTPKPHAKHNVFESIYRSSSQKSGRERNLSRNNRSGAGNTSRNYRSGAGNASNASRNYRAGAGNTSKNYRAGAGKKSRAGAGNTSRNYRDGYENM